MHSRICLLQNSNIFGPLYTSTRYRHPTYPHQRPTANQLTNSSTSTANNQFPHFHYSTPLTLSPSSLSPHKLNHEIKSSYVLALISYSDPLLHTYGISKVGYDVHGRALLDSNSVWSSRTSPCNGGSNTSTVSEKFYTKYASML
ncbi:hypothetical protein L1887_14315 [Cichorium endivia]|nr:hypothetical protein L1887_14315 [Cichorium endivia]